MNFNRLILKTIVFAAILVWTRIASAQVLEKVRIGMPSLSLS